MGKDRSTWLVGVDTSIELNRSDSPLKRNIMECNDCIEKDKTIACLKRILLKAQVCDREKYLRIKQLELVIKNSLDSNRGYLK